MLIIWVFGYAGFVYKSSAKGTYFNGCVYSWAILGKNFSVPKSNHKLKLFSRIIFNIQVMIRYVPPILWLSLFKSSKPSYPFICCVPPNELSLCHLTIPEPWPLDVHITNQWKKHYVKVLTSFLNTQQYIRYPTSHVHIAYTTDPDLFYTDLDPLDFIGY